MVKSHFFGLFLLLASFMGKGEAINCQLVPPTQQQSGPGTSEIGLIFIPGADIGGLAYKPLVAEIQRQFPSGRVWAGLTDDWYIGGLPNPLQIKQAINLCYHNATSHGYSTDNIILAGHSLGGIVAESYAKDNAKGDPNLKGLLLYGAFIPDQGNRENPSNNFPVPALCAMGTLDGGLPYAFREWSESNQSPDTQHDSPVLLVEGVNHGQVASGDINNLPATVVNHDVDSDLTIQEAHSRYAKTAIAFIVTATTTRHLFPEDTVADQNEKMGVMKAYTKSFFDPFVTLSQLESTIENGVKVSPWMRTAELFLVGANDSDTTAPPDLSQLTVNTELLDSFGHHVPSSTVGGDKCQDVTVKTYSVLKFDSDMFEHDHLVAAKVMKAKMMMAFRVLDDLCQPQYVKRWHCGDVNRQAYQLAMSLASNQALDRFMAIGTQLEFTADYETWWGPGWELDGGLNYKKVGEKLMSVTATSLIAPGVTDTHYCDLLTPYRALEWIYTESVRHGGPFQ